jgi:hypothetical protein
MIQLVHVLACDNKWIFKMHGATIKISIGVFDWQKPIIIIIITIIIIIEDVNSPERQTPK